MSLAIFGLVLLAALLHAGWNAVLKSGGDRFRSIVVMVATAGLACVPAAALLPLPARAAWPALAITTVLHVGYNLFLVRAYRYGDLGQVYPVARGSSPILVTLGAALTAGERPGAAAALGIALSSVGILSLARGFGREGWRGLLVAVTTGGFIAGYTVTDGLGARLSGHALAYAAWSFCLEGAAMPACYLAARGIAANPFAVDRATARSAAGGLVSLVAYTAVIYAASVSPMGSVSALRETSVVFAALIGWLVLGERMSGRRMASCCLVALGAVSLGLTA